MKILGNHHLITPTARMVAYFRSFSDIPFAKEISDIVFGEGAARQLLQEDLDLMTRVLAPVHESRYKCFEYHLSKYRNVLEIAVGTSVQRGLFVVNESHKTYIGTDLPGMIAEARQVLLKIAEPKPHLHFLAADALSYDNLVAATVPIVRDGDLLIIHEGFWPYLARDEQLVCATNIHKLLKMFGGLWVTPDIDYIVPGIDQKKFLSQEFLDACERTGKRWRDVIGRDVQSNGLRSPYDAIQFLNQSGFNVERHYIFDKLVSLPSTVHMWSMDERSLLMNLLCQQTLWVMSPR